MRLPGPLLQGKLIKRYKRFLADIELSGGKVITAHCANPGSMMGVAIPGARAWVSEHHNEKRKLPYSWQLVEVDKTLIPVNTSNPNKIAEEAIHARIIPELTGYDEVRREVKYGEASRIDLLLSGGRRVGPCYVEVKNVHLSRSSGIAEFPDSVTKRGARHLQELCGVKEQGARAVMLFIVQRSDCRVFRPAFDLDPGYGAALKSAAAKGVETLCYDCEVSLSEVVLRRALEIRL